MRSRFESKWSLFSDIDERLLMTKYPGTILDYLKEVNDPKIAGVQYRQQWIMKTEFMPDKYEGDKQVNKLFFNKKLEKHFHNVANFETTPVVKR